MSTAADQTEEYPWKYASSKRVSMMLRGFVRKVLASLDIDDTRKFCTGLILGCQKQRRPVKQMQQPKAALRPAATNPLQYPRKPSFQLMYLQEERMLAKVLLCQWRCLSLCGGIMSAILIFSKGWRRIVVATPLTIPYKPLSFIISNNCESFIQQQSHYPYTNSHYIRNNTVSSSISFIIQQSKMSKKRIYLVQHFLKDSPINQHRKFMKIAIIHHNNQKLPPILQSDKQYINNFLASLEVVQPPISLIKRSVSVDYEIQFKKMFRHQHLIHRNFSQSQTQTNQLLISIKQFCRQNLDSIIPYQQLQQRITIAKPQTLNAARIKLTYLFKVLINKRDKLPPASLELEANLQLSQAIIKAFSNNMEFGDNGAEWRKLQAIEKLMRAKDYKKQGYNQIAITSFQQIFKDQAAEKNTRLQALKLLCSQGQELGDASLLQNLMSLSQQKGQKEYEQYLKLSIKRIKQSLGNR